MCAHGKSQCAFGTFEVKQSEMKLTRLQRHEETETHAKAWQMASAATGLPGPQRDEDPVNAPPAVLFQDALKRRLDGLACEAGLPAHGIGPDKMRKLSFCLAEAKRMMVRTWLMDKAKTIALQQDERHQRLLLRFTAASDTLERKSGVIGLAKHFGSGAGTVSKTTEGVIRAFCSPGAMAPGRQQADSLNQDLLEAIRSKTEVFVADAAGDEQKAGELLRRRPTTDGEPFLPNIRLGFRDGAHASRRVIKRPFEADPTLRDIMQSVFFGKDSIVMAIENSLLVKNRFEHHVGKVSNTVKSVVRSLSMAKQRFDSTQKPLGRFVLWIEPLLSTVIELSREKRASKDENSLRAVAFLAFCSEEVLLQIAMIADAGDEGEQLCRCFDKEMPASEELSESVDHFLMKVTALFSSDEPSCLTTGYTNHMLRTLQKRELVLPTMDGKGVRTLGGEGAITAEMIRTCLARMRTWVALAKLVISHEYPEWDVISCFQIFNVNHAKQRRPGNQDIHIKRLIKFFALEEKEAEFRAQLQDVGALARCHAQNTACSSLDAWKSTLQTIQSSKRRRDRHPCDVLVTVLVRWAGWHPSSSGVEQSFGHGTYFATARQSHASESSECNDMVLLLDHDAAEEPQQVELARQARGC